MNQDLVNYTFDLQTVADDMGEVRRIYAEFFARLTDEDWERPVKGSPKEWNLQHTVAHLCALSGTGLASIEAALRGESYHFEGLADRYQFDDFNLRGIDVHLPVSRPDLCAEFLGILDRAIEIARTIRPEQADILIEMPIYNRPVKVIETICILLFHAGLHHSAQVAEPAHLPPLWMLLTPDIRHRVIGRVMCALSLLYRYDLGGNLRTAFTFDMDGPGGGTWVVHVSPEAASAEETDEQYPGLTLHLREPGVFCRMFTGRFNPIISLLDGDLRLKGDWPLFLRFGTLFSVTAHN
jgi:hypothetical protein